MSKWKRMALIGAGLLALFGIGFVAGMAVTTRLSAPRSQQRIG